MTKKGSILEKDSRLDILAHAAIFEDDFSIDWVIELTGKKAMEVLAALEYGGGEPMDYHALNRDVLFYGYGSALLSPVGLKPLQNRATPRPGS